VCQCWIVVLTELIVVLNFLRHLPLIGLSGAKSMLT
jgi:hypothetical protein